MSAAAPLLVREAFQTSRLADFASQKELVAQTGHPVEEWPLVVIKEGVDNAIDACEDAGIAPAIDISIDLVARAPALLLRDSFDGLGAFASGGVASLFLVGSGILHSVIADAATVCGTSIGNLTVLSPGNATPCRR